MLIGFVLILSSATNAMPVSERIYHDKAACEQIKSLILERRPNAQLICSPVYR